MPLLTVHTNALVNDKETFVAAATDFIATELRKPVNYIVVNINSNPEMGFGGDCLSTGAWVELRSIGFENKDILAHKLTKFLVENLAVYPDMVNIEFVNITAENFAIGGNLLG